MYQCKYEKLFTPIRLGNVMFRNRIFAAPTGAGWGLEGNSKLSEEAIAFYESKARGGAAVVAMGECIVHAKTGQSHDVQFLLEDSGALISLTKFARAVKRHGAVPSAELSHGGKWGGLAGLYSHVRDDVVAYGPSPEILPQGEVKEMPREILLEIIDSFGKGAAMMKKAGLEMVMVHAGHGWLFGQFLSPKTNRRTDEFGGCTENRVKPLIMALEAIRKAVGPGFPIEVRISGDEFVEGGITIPEAVKIVKLIQDKCDLVNVSAGIHEDAELYIRTHPNQYLPQTPNAYLAEAIRREVSIPISTVGGFNHPEFLDHAVNAGIADIVELGRPRLADPELPNKMRTGREAEIVHCLRCNGCFDERRKSGIPACTLNPVYTNFIKDQNLRSEPTEPKRVMVVGGGPGGMKAALTAAQRGHEVVLYEKKDRLGGNLNLAEHVDFKYGLYEFKETMEYMLKKHNVRIVLNTPVTRETVEKEQPDALFVAVGAVPIFPRIPGIQSDKVILATEMFNHLDRVGETVIVLGGGFVGCEVAAHLAREGRRVTIVEMRDDIAMDDGTFGQAAIKVDLRKNSVRVLTGASGEEISEAGLTVRYADGRRELIPADTIINAVGRRSDFTLYSELALLAPTVKLIGDCRQPGKVTNAVADAHFNALDI